MNKNCVNQKSDIFLRKADYEQYQIILPYKFLFGRNRNRFIYSELEKMHPCFSDEFSFDAKASRFSKKGLISDVMVIHKYKLADYEGRRAVAGKGISRITGSGFLAESCERHRFFVSEKIRKRFLVIILIFVVALVLSFIWRLQGTDSQVLGLENNSLVTSDEVHQNENQFYSSSEKCLIAEKFFSEVKSAGGKISAFHWKISGFTESYEIKVKNIFPEQLTCMTMTTVTYSDGVPDMQVSCSRKMQRNQKISESDSEENFHKALRNILLKNNATIKEEKLNPYSISFSCASVYTEKVLEELDKQFVESGKNLLSVDFVQSDKGEWNISISELENVSLCFDSDLSLKLIGDNFCCFGAVSEKSSLKKSAAPEQISARQNDYEKSGCEKIGEIKNADGTSIIFYKNSEGKILKILEENRK